MGKKENYLFLGLRENRPTPMETVGDICPWLDPLLAAVSSHTARLLPPSPPTRKAPSGGPWFSGTMIMGERGPRPDNPPGGRASSSWGATEAFRHAIMASTLFGVSSPWVHGSTTADRAVSSVLGVIWEGTWW